MHMEPRRTTGWFGQEAWQHMAAGGHEASHRRSQAAHCNAIVGSDHRQIPATIEHEIDPADQLAEAAE
jgi:hypothetical protein